MINSLTKFIRDRSRPGSTTTAVGTVVQHGSYGKFAIVVQNKKKVNPTPKYIWKINENNDYDDDAFCPFSVSAILYSNN